MQRREFIKSSLVVATTVSFLNSCVQKEAASKKNYLSGFIFSDAHIGWKGKEQPTIEVQKEAIQTIKSKFPNLDLVFDTGDIHHGNLSEDEKNEARDHWLSGFSNPFSQALFHYVPGNHELGKGLTDTEVTAIKLGSQNLRPYYSFDYKGIHFISLPQLLDTILINRESLDWLDFDLSLNRDKTTLIFSHNSLSGTTYNNNRTGYRTVVNSQEVFDVINKYKNVIAWLHGHNHQYEIVNKENILYVSNGRIGGFNPPKSWGDFGQGHLGGVYFAINKQGITIKCYSTSKKEFLHNLGYKKLSQKLKLETSFDSTSGFNYYFGHGSLTNNVEHKITNHYHSNKDISVFTRPIVDEVLNDNSDLQIPTNLLFGNKKANRIIGYGLTPKDLKIETVPTGLYIVNKATKTITIKLPNHTMQKNNLMIRGSYFRCELGDTFSIKLNFDFLNKSTQNECVTINYYVYDEHHKHLVESQDYILKPESNNDIVTIISTPVIKNQDRVNRKYIRFSFKFKEFPTEFIVNKIELTKKVSHIGQSALDINGKTHIVPTNISLKIAMRDFQKQGRASIKYIGKTPVTCIIKVQDVLWQIRNAISQFKNNSIELITYRHQFQKIKEVIITPTNDHSFYLNKVIDIMPLRIEYNDKHINIQFFQINNHSKLVFATQTLPKKITGTSKIITQKNRLVIVPETKNIQIWL